MNADSKKIAGIALGLLGVLSIAFFALRDSGPALPGAGRKDRARDMKSADTRATASFTVEEAGGPSERVALVRR